MSSTTESDFQELLGIIRSACDLQAAAALLEWDQETYMPEAGTEDRARQIATLQSTSHELFVRDRTGELLERVKDEYEDSMSFRASIVRVAARISTVPANYPRNWLGKLRKPRVEPRYRGGMHIAKTNLTGLRVIWKGLWGCVFRKLRRSVTRGTHMTRYWKNTSLVSLPRRSKRF